MIDIRTTPIGRQFTYTELIDSTDAVWGGIAWPGPEKPGCVVAVAAGKTRYADGWEVSIIDEEHSFDVRELVKAAMAMDLKYWITRPRVDQSGSPSGRWIGDETHDAADKFLAESTFQMSEIQPGIQHLKPRTLQLTRTVLLDMEHLYDFLMPKIKTWLSPAHQLLFLKAGYVASQLNEFSDEQSEREQVPAIGMSPAVEAVGYAAVEMQEWLEQRFNTRVHTRYSKADRGATRLLGSY